MDADTMTHKPFVQPLGSGLCGPLAIINALRVLFPNRVTEAVQEELVGAVCDAFPGDGKCLIKDGAERPEMVQMLNGLARWTQAHDWPHWHYHDLHPIRGEPADEFWEAVQEELAEASTGKTRVAALVGFGEDSRPGTRYEPHFTCVVGVSGQFIRLADSSVYKRIPRKDTGIRPEQGWSVEDCFILRRAA